MKVTILHGQTTLLQLEAGDSGLPTSDRLQLVVDALRGAVLGRLRDYPGAATAQSIHIKLGRSILWAGVRDERELDSAITRLIDRMS
jgi:hypothetical protein